MNHPQRSRWAIFQVLDGLIRPPDLLCLAPMTGEMFQKVLAKAEASGSAADGAKLPEGRTLTLYVANNGASMTVGDVVSVKLDDDAVEAENKKGVCHILALADVYAASVKSEGEGNASRKAGFRG